MEETSDLAFFAALARHPTLTAAAQDLGITGPAVSRRLAALETRLGVRLLNRTTRRQSLTAEGERYLEEGQRILRDIEQLERELTSARQDPRGLLRVNSGIGFGSRHVGPAIAAFIRLYPEVDIILHLTDRPVDMAAEAIDLSIRVGLIGDTGLMTRKIAANHRYLCASPDYLARHAPPKTPDDLKDHQCIVIRENFGAYNTWPLVSGTTKQTVKVNGRLASNHGEVAVDWARAGHGIVLRSQWDVASYLRSGDLVRVLPDWSGVDADIHAFYLQRHHLSAKVRVFLDFFAERFAEHRRSDASW